MIPTIIISAVLAAVVGLIIYRMICNAKSKQGGCASCGYADTCAASRILPRKSDCGCPEQKNSWLAGSDTHFRAENWGTKALGIPWSGITTVAPGEDGMQPNPNGSCRFPPIPIIFAWITTKTAPFWRIHCTFLHFSYCVYFLTRWECVAIIFIILYWGWGDCVYFWIQIPSFFWKWVLARRLGIREVKCDSEFTPFFWIVFRLCNSAQGVSLAKKTD